MALIGYTEGAEVRYVPVYGGNRAAAEQGCEDPCVITLKYVPYGKVLEYSKLIVNRTKLVRDAERQLEATHEIQRKQFVEGIAKVEGYIVNGQPITTGAQLWDVAPAELIKELLEAMESSARLTEGQIKN